MVSLHVLYFWQRGIRKLELERTKFGKFASQGTNNSRSWKFKFEGVLDHKIYLHERHIFFSPHFREHSSCWNYSIFDIVLRNAPFCKPLLPCSSADSSFDLHRKFYYIFEIESIFAEPKRNLEAIRSKDPLFEDCACQKIRRSKPIRLNEYRFPLFFFLWIENTRID